MPDQYPPNAATLRALGYEAKTIPAGTVLWRIHFTASGHVVPWNRLRTWGPVPGSRWEPHPLPPGDAAPLGAAYLGEDVLTCLAEVFQLTRFVDVDRDDPYVTAFSTTRDLVLADLTGDWLLPAGGSAQIAFGEKERTRAWARAIHETWPDLDGVYSLSAMALSRKVVTLWTEDAIPAAPEFSSPLNAPGIVSDVMAAAAKIRYTSNIIL
ncbi:RES family NAD+ phosphorylase [Pseudarthrobacter sp. MDT3-26]|uniref:RES family NAD+ phosphorylase n=1 Tax=Pseudarthrobacter raffinosi TaxID=2953651 RepID=UPI00208F6239|nr:RES family NAD+ phosphorylase [Pseudarthrobacter sp. MDT3-26]MCO4265287.1 RES family NAD+ phosphorylase [Pseudarthrobacter sp. MDT3-26]